MVYTQLDVGYELERVSAALDVRDRHIALVFVSAVEEAWYVVRVEKA